MATINSIGSNIPVEITLGGTGVSTMTTAFAVVCAGTTATNPLQTIASVGSAGEVLTSNGVGSLPTFQAGGGGSGDVVGPGSSTDNAAVRFDGATGKLVQDSGVIIDDSDNITGPLDVTMTGILNLNAAVSSTAAHIEQSGTRIFHTFGTENVFVGSGSGNFTLTGDENVAVGHNCMPALTTGLKNVCLGFEAGVALTTGGRNVAIGRRALFAGTAAEQNLALGNGALSGGTTAACTFNVALGPAAGFQITTGAYNCLVGNNAGQNYTSTESDNICIMSDGTVADQNTIRIGTQGTGNGQQDTTFVVGINGATAGAAGNVVISDTSHQLAGTGHSGGTTLDSGAGDFTITNSTGNTLVADNSGWVTKPLQPAFLAYLPTNDNNVTGDGGTYTLGGPTTLTEVFDQNADFTASTGTFQAPVTGRYFLYFTIRTDNTTDAMDNAVCTIVTSNRDYSERANPGVPRTSTNLFQFRVTALADMDATDTATFTLVISNGGAGDTADVDGSSTLLTYVCGHLVA